jgi:uncharacterized membrane protein
VDTSPAGLLLVAALGSATVAGAFAVFSVMVMPALAALPAPNGVVAMQSVNRVALRPLFMTALFGTALICLTIGVWELLAGARPAVLLAAGLYLLGPVVVTVVVNVPLNDELAGTDAASADAQERWPGWVRRWTTWNSIRSAAALAASGLFVALLAGWLG